MHMRKPAGSFHSQELPSIHSTLRPVDVVRVPCKDRPQDLGIQIEGCLQGGRVMKAEIGSEPVENPWFTHYRHGRLSSL